mmetsp:Transcript_48151/g.89250  ORF Transcript_48151/g.89250 Transcript_48151/m.89250 type:complete len:87 (+) Transcript_48151:1342-1602(+)
MSLEMSKVKTSLLHPMTRSMPMMILAGHVGSKWNQVFRTTMAGTVSALRDNLLSVTKVNQLMVKVLVAFGAMKVARTQEHHFVQLK